MGLKDKIKDWAEKREKDKRSKAAQKQLRDAQELAKVKKELAQEKARADIREDLRNTKQALKENRARAGGTRLARAKERFGKVRSGVQKASEVMNKISTGSSGTPRQATPRTGKRKIVSYVKVGDRIVPVYKQQKTAQPKPKQEAFHPLFGKRKPRSNSGFKIL